MSTWQEFYKDIKDPLWPDCAEEEDFHKLPEAIQEEIKTVFQYQINSFKKTSGIPNKVFPIKTKTACTLKWNWSTIYLTTDYTASCHRTNHHKFDDNFDFHNTPEKIDDRRRMLDGQWPKKGCDYCKVIEQAGGQSDRITNLDYPGIYAPVELDTDVNAVVVTPRILEVYFDNTCNLKCLYCGSHFSSLWAAEDNQFGAYNKQNFIKSSNLEINKQKMFEWLKNNRQHLTHFNVLGGEPLYQPELDQVLDLFANYPAPNLKLQMFSNLNCKKHRLETVIQKARDLIDKNCIREFEVTASLDCWGVQQEYVRFPLNLSIWKENFELLLKHEWINLIISSTITPLTIKTLPTLLEHISQWSRVRKVYHYQNSVNGPDFLCIDIFGDIFKDDFDKALSLKPSATAEDLASKLYLEGIAKQSASNPPNVDKIKELFDFLNEMDRRRKTSWPTVFPWLVREFEKYDLRKVNTP